MFNKDIYTLLFCFLYDFLSTPPTEKNLEQSMRILMYFCEADYYELYEKQLTGDKYFVSFYDGLPISQYFNDFFEQKNEIVCNLGLLEYKYEDIVDHIHNVIGRLAYIDPNKLSDYCRKDMPIQAATQTANHIIIFPEINFEYVFYRDPEYEVRKYPLCSDCFYEYHDCHFKNLYKMRDKITKCEQFKEW